MRLLDNVVLRFFSRIFDFMMLNILWVICSIPVITIGASTSALYSVMLKLVKNEEGYIVRGFFSAFKENFKKSTILWLIILVAGVVVGADFMLLREMQVSTMMRGIFFYVILFVGLMTASLAIYAFPLIARYENTVKQTIKNALMLAIAKLPSTVCMLLITFIPIIMTFYSAQVMVIAVVIWLACGVSVLAWMNSNILRKVFTIFETKEDVENE